MGSLFNSEEKLPDGSSCSIRFGDEKGSGAEESSGDNRFIPGNIL